MWYYSLLAGDPFEFLELFIAMFNMDIINNFEFLLMSVSRAYVDKVFEKMSEGDLETRVGCMYQLLNSVYKVKPTITSVQFMQNRFTAQKVNAVTIFQIVISKILLCCLLSILNATCNILLLILIIITIDFVFYFHSWISWTLLFPCSLTVHLPRMPSVLFQTNPQGLIFKPN